MTLVVMGGIREIIGNGTIFGFVLNSGSIIPPMLIFILPPGGFFVFGVLVALANKLAAKKGKEPAKLGCASCPAASSCGKATEGGCK